MTVHVLEGPYTIQDLSLLDAGRMPTMSRTHQLRTRVSVCGGGTKSGGVECS